MFQYSTYVGQMPWRSLALSRLPLRRAHGSNLPSQGSARPRTLRSPPLPSLTRHVTSAWRTAHPSWSRRRASPRSSWTGTLLGVLLWAATLLELPNGRSVPVDNEFDGSGKSGSANESECVPVREGARSHEEEVPAIRRAARWGLRFRLPAGSTDATSALRVTRPTHPESQCMRRIQDDG